MDSHILWLLLVPFHPGPILSSLTSFLMCPITLVSSSTPLFPLSWLHFPSAGLISSIISSTHTHPHIHIYIHIDIASWHPHWERACSFCLSESPWLLLSSSTSFPTKFITLFFFAAEYNSIVYTCHIFSIYSSTDGQLGCFCSSLWAIF